MTAFMANDGESLSLGDIDLLVGEIERLRTHASKLESRIQELDRLVYRDTLVDVSRTDHLSPITSFGDQSRWHSNWNGFDRLLKPIGVRFPFASRAPNGQPVWVDRRFLSRKSILWTGSQPPGWYYPPNLLRLFRGSNARSVVLHFPWLGSEHEPSRISSFPGPRANPV